MVKKKVDERIRTVIENGIKTRQRSIIVCLGDKGRDQVVTLHYMLSKASIKTRPKVLWCYKKDLGFTSNRVKRQKKIKRDIDRGLRQPDTENPFEIFVGSTDIRYTYYKESHKVLGNTYGMCILQDFEALTPNILARTIETVEGGGLIVLLLNNMSSLQQLYTLTMDVHARFRTESHQDVTCRFNERFLLSLGSCPTCIMIDDELNILPITSHIRAIKPVNVPDQEMNEKGDYVSAQEKELKSLQVDLRETQPVGALVECARTLDQAKAVLNFLDAISEKTLRSTVVLTAARGRGKSAALGFAIAGAIAYGYSNIFVTAPSPENLNTLFAMIFKAFEALDIKEHQDYEAIQSTNPEFHKAIVRVNVFREHRQTIQFIQPQDHEKLAQAELLVIDEAAAIPLPMVKKLLGPYLVFMSSTVNGYEGTGRSLSLKLVKQLRQQSNSKKDSGKVDGSLASARVLREITLEEPIRYAQGDMVEKWLNGLLCLDCTNKVPRLSGGLPHPSQCQLFHVNRDSLFSYHKASEAFLQRMMSLYVSSHYKNTPNDLQLMSDAPSHEMFVLIGPVKDGALPDILVVIQVCMEGAISKESVLKSLARGKRDAGDLIPWCISQQFQNNEFATLSGARVVRIATHPELSRMGYATRSLELLSSYFQGDMTNLDEKDDGSTGHIEPTQDAVNMTEALVPRKNLPPLLTSLADRKPEGLHWLGVSFGCTQDLYNFWGKNGFKPVYLRLTPNDLTGEHTCIMIKPHQNVTLETVPNQKWLDSFHADFQRRFVSLLGFDFQKFPAALGLAFLFDPNTPCKNAIGLKELGMLFTEFDLKRLESYARNLVDYHMILDLVPPLARLLFCDRLPVSLSFSQAAILLGLGLQHKSVSTMEKELGLPSNQILALFNKAIRKMSTHMRSTQEKQVRDEITDKTTTKEAPSMKPLATSLRQESQQNTKEVHQQMKEKNRKLIEQGIGDLQRYAITGTDEDWSEKLDAGAGASVSIKSSKERPKPRFERSGTPASKGAKGGKSGASAKLAGKKRKKT